MGVLSWLPPKRNRTAGAVSKRRASLAAATRAAAGGAALATRPVDAEVVRRLGGRTVYLESLVEVARFAARSRAVPVAPFLRESHLRERVDLLLPPDAKAEKVEGIFRIHVTIGIDGAAKQARIAASAPTDARLEEIEAKKGAPATQEGDARLARAALEAVKQWRWARILRGGKPVEADATATVAFKIY